MDNTKAVQLTADEVQRLLQYHGQQISNSPYDITDYVERLRYLNKRLKDFDEPTKTVEIIKDKSSW